MELEHRINIEATVNIDYPIIVERINKDLSELQPLNSECCIHRVQKGLRKVNPEAYEPMIVSIGPYHLQNPRLQSMKKHKLWYLRSLLERRKESVEWYIVEFEKLEDKVRKYYAEPIDLNSEKFVEMMLLDACFILGLFRDKKINELFRDHKIDSNKEINPVLDEEWMQNQIYSDLMLLENQLPFFLLSELYDMITKKNPDDANHNPNDGPEDPDHDLGDNPDHNPNEDPSHDPMDVPFMEMAISSLVGTIPEPFRNFELVKKGELGKIKHLLHLVHLLCHPSSKQTSSEVHTKEIHNQMRSAIELEEAGVKFNKVISDLNTGSTPNLFDINFQHGSMGIPFFTVDDSTDTFFRNLIAFEQHSRDVNPKYFTDFADFMDQLISSEKDVKLLRHKGIIDNLLGNDQEVSNLFNKLRDGVLVSSPKDSYYFQECKKVNSHCKKCWNKNRAKLCHNYFNSPWAGISTIAAAVLLVLTLLQTISSFIYK